MPKYDNKVVASSNDTDDNHIMTYDAIYRIEYQNSTYIARIVTYYTDGMNWGGGCYMYEEHTVRYLRDASTGEKIEEPYKDDPYAESDPWHDALEWAMQNKPLFVIKDSSQ